MPIRPPSALPLLVLGLSVLLAACQREEVARFRVPKSAAAPETAALGAPPRSGPPPGMAGDLPPPPAPERALAWTLPKGWTEERQGGMRFATLKAPVPGRLDGSVIVLPGPAGGELPNVNRWRGQIGLEPIDEAALRRARTEVRSKVGSLSVYDFSSDGAQPSRVIVGLLETGGSTWFVKLTGDAKAVSAARADFLSLLGSLRLD